MATGSERAAQDYGRGHIRVAIRQRTRADEQRKCRHGRHLRRMVDKWTVHLQHRTVFAIRGRAGGWRSWDRQPDDEPLVRYVEVQAASGVYTARQSAAV